MANDKQQPGKTHFLDKLDPPRSSRPAGLPKFGRMRSEAEGAPADAMVTPSAAEQVPTLEPALPETIDSSDKSNNSTDISSATADGGNSSPVFQGAGRTGVPTLEPGDNTQGRKVMLLPLSELVANDSNPRIGYDPKDVEDLAISMARDRQKVPILVTRFGGQWMIVEGETRVRAARKLKWTVIEAVEIEAPGRADRYVAGHTANAHRASLTNYDDGVAWGGLIKDGVFSSYAEISRALGLDLSKAELSRMKAYADLRPEIIDAMKPHKAKFTSSYAYMVRQVQEHGGVRRALSFVHEIASKDLSVSQAEGRKRDICGEDREGSRQRSRIHRVMVGDREVGRVFVKPNGRIEVAMTDVSEDEATRLGGMVASLLSENVKP